jgi:hypothetical protein
MIARWLPVLAVLVVGCGKTAPHKAIDAAAPPAAKPRPVAASASLPASAQGLLALVPEDARVTAALLDARGLYRVVGAIETSLRRLPLGAQLLLQARAAAARAPVPVPLSASELRRLGVDETQPLMIVIGERSPLALFGVSDAVAVKRSLLQLATRGRGAWGQTRRGARSPPQSAERVCKVDLPFARGARSASTGVHWTPADLIEIEARGGRRPPLRDNLAALSARSVAFLALLAAVALDAQPAAARAGGSAAAAAGALHASSLPRGSVFAPSALFSRGDRIDRAILESNALVYVYPDFDRAAEKILVVGMDGWGGRSENLIEALRSGLRAKGLTRRLVLAAIQDPVTRGPLHQGQKDREHANAWILVDPAIPALHRLASGLAEVYGPLRVYFLGFSTGGTAAPVAAVRVARHAPAKRFRVAGAIAVGGWTHSLAEEVRALGQRVAFIAAPRKRRKEPPAVRFDQSNRDWAESSHAQLRRGRAESSLTHIESARRHPDWHWGLLSQCRFFPSGKPIGPRRGLWPHYRLPNPDTFWAIREFLEGRPVRRPPRHAPTICPY